MRTAALTLLCIPLLVGCLETDDLVAPTVTEDPALPRIALDDTVLRGETFGDSGDPLVVLLHGGPGMDYTGMRRLTALADAGYYVLAYDQRGGGLSERHAPGEVSARVHADDLAELIARYGDGPAILVGHSWGGMLAALEVQQHPELVASVVLIEPGPFNSDRWARLDIGGASFSAPHFNDLLWSQQVIVPDDHAAMDWHFMQLMSDQIPGYHMSDTDPMPFTRSGFVAYRDVVLADPTSTSWEVAEWDFITGTEAWPGTAHFIWSDMNTTMDARFRAEQEADWARTTTVTIEGAGHDVPWVLADDVVTHLLEVL